MTKQKLIFYLDICFFIFSGLILSLPIFNSFLSLPLNLVCGLLFGIILSIFLGIILKKKQEKSSSAFKDNKLYQDVLLSLNLMNRQELFDFIRSYLDKREIEYNESRAYFAIPKLKTCLFVKFSFSSVEKVDIVRFFNLRLDGYSATVIAESFSNEVSSFAKRFNGKFTLISFPSFFAELKKYQLYPKTKYILDEENKKTKLDFKSFLKKKNAKSFFTFGATMLFLSFFVQIKLYYLICGSIFIILSLLAVLFGIEGKKINE